MRVLWMMGVGVLIRCFSPQLIWCDNPNCPILVGGHKGVGLHQLVTKVILIYYKSLTYIRMSIKTPFLHPQINN